MVRRLKMKIEPRRIFDFIMGGCAGFCFFYGGFLATSVGVLMLITFVINVYRDTMLEKIDKSLEEDNGTS